MATLEFGPSSGRYRIRFRLGGRPFKRSLKTRDEAEANAVVARVQETIRIILRGRLEIPPGADLGAFILSDGKWPSKPQLPAVLTLGGLFLLYRKPIPAGTKEANTRVTEELHCKHLERIIGSNASVQGLSAADVHRYGDKRAREIGRRGRVRPPTIKKE